MYRFLLILILVFIVAAPGCKNVVESTKEEVINKTGFRVDTTSFHIDTTISNVAIHKEKFTVYILKDRFDESLIEYDFSDEYCLSPISLIIINEGTNKVVYQNRFEANLFGLFKVKGELSGEGKLYLKLMADAGGSGFQGYMYMITQSNGKIEVSQVFKYNELAMFAFGKSDKLILLLKGIWNMDEEESHFGDHRFRVYRLDYQGSGFNEKLLGETRKKYGPLDEVNQGIDMRGIVMRINTNEPELLKQVKISEYF